MILSTITHLINPARAAFLAVALALVFVLAACSGGAANVATPPPAPAVAPESAANVAPATPATPAPAVAPAAAATEAPAASTTAAPDTPTAPAPVVNVVTTTNIVADWARAVGQDRVNVFSLVPTGSDPHAFQPGAKSVAQVADADLVLSVGLSLEAGWMDKLLENAARNPDTIVALGEAANPLEFVEMFDDPEEHDDHDAVAEAAGHEEHEEHDDHDSAEEADGHEEHDDHDSAEEADGHEEHDDHDSAEEGDGHEEEDDHDSAEEADGHEEHDDHDSAEEGDGHEEEDDHDSAEEGDGHEEEDDHDSAEEGDGHEEEDDHDSAEEADGHEEHGEGESGGHQHGALDPHIWFDPLRVQQVVNAIAAELSRADPAGQAFYQENAAAYNRELDALHAWIQEQVATLPEERRLLVTSHDSFRYFAVRYGFQVVGAVIPSTTTEVEPTAQELSQLIETIEHVGAPAVFGENTQSNRLAQRIAEETGAKLIGTLYTGSLGQPGGEAGTYPDLMRYNTTTIVEALR